MTVVQILALGLAALLVLIYGLMSAASNADDADDESYGRLLPRRRQ